MDSQFFKDIFGEDITIIKRGQKLVPGDDDIAKLRKIELERKFLEINYSEEKFKQLQLKHTRGRIDTRTMNTKDFITYEKEYRRKRLYIQDIINTIRYR